MAIHAANRIADRRVPSLDALTFGGYFAYLGILSLITHFTRQTWFGFFFAPLPMLFLRMDNFRFMLLAFAGYLLYFPGNLPGSNFLFFNTPDSLVLAYIGLFLFNRRGYAVFSIPFSPGLTPLYAFIIYGFALSVGPVLEFGSDFYVMRDIKNLCFLLLVPMLGRDGEPMFAPKALFHLLCGILAFTSLHAVIVLAEFLIAGGRVITWNEVFFADGVLLVPILLGLDLSKRIRGFLFASLVLCLMGLLACETRGLWISAAASFLVYASLRIRKAGFIGFDGLRKLLPALVLLVVSAEAILRLSSGTGLGGFILNRLTAHSANELVNPWSSLGYRIHESLVVWQKRTWFGHGSGARLYLFFTQLGMSKFINWWSIHSEYFETLHKYGFIGLGLLVWFLAATLRRALRLALRSARYPSTIGFAVLITLLNHCLVSITSGYLIRENVMLYMVVLVCMVERYLPRIEPIASKTSRPMEAPPVPSGASETPSGAARKKRTESRAPPNSEPGWGIS
jgi:hypothetical protein